MHSFRIIIRTGCKGAVLARGALHGPRGRAASDAACSSSMEADRGRAVHLGSSGTAAPSRGATGGRGGLPAATPKQRARRIFAVCGSHTLTHTHTHARAQHARAPRTAVGESESDHGSRGSGRLRTNSSCANVTIFMLTNSTSVWRWEARGEGLRRRLWLPLPGPRRAARAAPRGWRCRSGCL